MFKRAKFGIICVIFFIICVINVFAEETLTITTYYPSPYGSYNELYVASKLGIGTTSPDEKFEVEWVADGTDAEIGRGTINGDITFIALRNASGTKCYIYPNATKDGLVVTTTKP